MFEITVRPVSRKMKSITLCFVALFVAVLAGSLEWKYIIIFHLYPEWILIQFSIFWTVVPPLIEQKIAAKHDLLEGRVFGGPSAYSGQYPYQLIVQVRSRRNQSSAAHFCGASLIREDIAISAAHCVIPYANISRRYQVIAGAINVFDSNSGSNNGPNHGPNHGPSHGPNHRPNHGPNHGPNYGHGRYYVASDPTAQSVRLSSIKIHEDFNITSRANDICILHLSRNLTYTSSVQKISLPSPNAAFPIGAILTVTGFGGRNQQRNRYYRRLRGANVTVFETCDASYPNETTEGNFCAGTLGRGACQDDGGDSLADVINNTLWGIASKHLNCGQTNAPTVYTNILYYLDWINDNLATWIERTSRTWKKYVCICLFEIKSWGISGCSCTLDLVDAVD